jgi:glycerophosphoryl diester phosphodiesterase
LAAIKAVVNGSSFLDADIRFTRTNNPVLLHNADLGLFNARDVLIADVSTTEAGHHLSNSNQNIQTLTQFRDLILATGTPQVSLEPKVRPTTSQWNTVVSTLRPIFGRVLINSFNLSTLADAHARRFGPLAINTAVDVTPSQIPSYVHIVIQRFATLDATTTAKLIAAGKEVWSYECDNATAWQAAKDVGVTGFATDNWIAAQAWVDTH